MTALLDCPEIDCWAALLGETLSLEQRDTFERHLETCPVCQERIDRAQECQDDLRKLGQQFGDPTRTPVDPLLSQVRERLREVQSPIRSTQGEAADLSFLRPAERPGILGRLGEYEVLEEIGQGGMGIVLKASDPSLHRLVAVKVMAPFLASSATARRRFTREAQAAAAVCHDHIVTVHGVHEENGLPYLVMQFVAGESLQARLDRTGPLEVVEIVRIGLQTAQGLAAAHAQGLIHRDIKPANLLLENGLARVKITDFGLARMTDDAQLTRDGVVAGTPEYMAPEQARGETVDHRADLFSLGSVLYAMCTGLPPFRGATALAVLRQVSEQTPEPVRAVNPEIPAWLEALIGRLMAKNPADRFQSAAEVASLLEGYLAHLRQPLSVSAPNFVPLRPTWRKIPQRLVSRSSLVAASIFLAVMGLAAVGLLLVERGIANAGQIPVKPASENVDVWSVAVSTHGSVIAAGSGLWDQPGEIGVWNVKTREPLQRFAEELGVASVALSPDGRRLASGSWSGHVRVWDWAVGKQLFDFEVGHVARVAFSPDGRLLATATEDAAAQLWDLTTGKLLADLKADLKGDHFRFHCVAFSPDGKRVLAGGGDWDTAGTSQVAIWDAESKQQVNKLVGHSQPILSICYSPDGKTIATGSVDGTARLWDADSGKHLKTLTLTPLSPRHSAGWVEGLAFAADSKTLVTGSADGSVRFWDVEKAKEKRQFAIRGGVRTVRFTPDEDTLIVGGRFKTLKFFSPADMNEKGILWNGSDPRLVDMDLFPIATAHEPAKKRWLTAVGLIVLGTGCFLSLGFAVVRSLQHRRATPAPGEEPLVAGSISFACAHCGKNLKGKGLLAGKKVKCPNCGKPTAVPEQKTGEAPARRVRRWWTRLDVLCAFSASGIFAAALLVGLWISRPAPTPYLSRLKIFADRVKAERTNVIDARPISSSVSDKDLGVLRGLLHLRVLNLDHTESTDEGLKDIATLTNLVDLSLTNTQVTDNGLADLKSLTKLENLRLDRLPITDAGLARLSALPRLKSLSLYKTGVTDAGMAYLKELPALEVVSLDDTQIGDEGLRQLSQCKTLKRVKVWNTRVTAEGIRQLQEALPGVIVQK
jgi:serine/threonine protein kinase